MIITKEEVLKIADISRIAITEKEIDEIGSHLSDVINYAERVIQAAQLGEQESFYFNTNVFRNDESLVANPSSLLRQAPQEEADFFVVPAVLEQE